MGSWRREQERDPAEDKALLSLNFLPQRAASTGAEIADDCGLVVRDSFGNVETLHAGEVHIGAKGLQG